MKEAIKYYAEVVSNISEMEIEEAEKHLTTITEDYNINPREDLPELVKYIVKLSNDKGATINQIITALSQASEIANREGIDPEKTALYVATTAKVTEESGNIIGNHLKSFLSRINRTQEAKDELQKKGIVDFSKTSKVVDELVTKWKSFTDDEKQEIAVKVAGRYQMARFMILFEGLSENLESR